MPVSATATIVNPGQLVTYQSGGAPVTVQRSLPLTIFAPDTPGTYPVIVYSHGHTGAPVLTQGAGQTAAAWADLGYIVIAPTHLDSNANPNDLRTQFPVQDPVSSIHRAADLQFALTQAPAMTALLGAGYTADTSRVAVGGHSHGALIAGLLVGVEPQSPLYDLSPGNPYGIASVIDPRIDAAVLLSPQGVNSSWPGLTTASWENLQKPVFIVTGTADSEPVIGTGWETRLDLLRLSDDAPLYGAVYRGATHGQIGGSGVAGIRNGIAAITDTFLDAYLSGDGAARARLANTGAIIAADPLLTAYYERASPAFGGTAQGLGNLVGAAGADALTGLQTADFLQGFDGADTLSGGAGADSLYGGGGDDALVGGLGVNIYDGGDGNDALTAGEATADTQMILAGAGADSATGGDGRDWLYLGAGADIGLGGAGADVLAGDDGADSLDGGADGDLIFGGADNDTILGAGGADYLTGDGGDDLIRSGAGADTLVGGAGNDRLETDAANATGVLAYGEDGNDTLLGGAGADYFVLGAGNDSADGAAGNDVVLPGLGANTVRGGAGDDLGFGEGGDTLWDGGPGVNAFILPAGAGVDTILGRPDGGVQLVYGFTPAGAAADRVRLESAGFGSLAQLQAAGAITDFGGTAGYTLLRVDAASSILLVGVRVSDLSVDNFSFG